MPAVKQAKKTPSRSATGRTRVVRKAAPCTPGVTSVSKVGPSATLKVIVKKQRDGYVAYPVGFKGEVIGEGDTYEAAMADVTSAIAFHIETFGRDVLSGARQTIDVFVGEARVAG